MQRSTELHKILFDESPIGVCILDEDFRFVAANKAFCNLVEYTDHELSAFTLLDITHPVDAKECETKLIEMLAGKLDGFDIVKRLLSKLGDTVWVRESKFIIKNGDKMTFISQAIPVEHLKIEKNGHNNVVYRPTVSVGQFVGDNLVSFVGGTAFIISVLVTLGTLVGIQQYQISQLEQRSPPNAQSNQNPGHGS